jgi:hypothetical protein
MSIRKEPPGGDSSSEGMRTYDPPGAISRTPSAPVSRLSAMGNACAETRADPERGRPQNRVDRETRPSDPSVLTSVRCHIADAVLFVRWNISVYRIRRLARRRGM